jgi:hypothetical protein
MAGWCRFLHLPSSELVSDATQELEKINLQQFYPVFRTVQAFEGYKSVLHALLPLEPLSTLLRGCHFDKDSIQMELSHGVEPTA